MARPIRLRPDPSEEETAIAEALAPELAVSKESLRDLLELIRLLDERGFLRFAADALREEDRVVEVVSERFRPEELRRILRNLGVLYRTFQDLDPETLGTLARGVPAALEEAHRAESDRQVGILDVVSALREPEVNRGVRMVLGFLRGIGRGSGP
jgi:uncharacterized protein YjgD (DUF1641 family)